MGSLIKIGENNPNPFPDTKFTIEGEVPAAQCTEAKIAGLNATTSPIPDPHLTDPGAFTGYNLTGKICHITYSEGGAIGPKFIISNNDNSLEFGADPGFGSNVQYHVTDGGSLILTRNVESFAQFIHTQGYAYTFKGGKLHTNCPQGSLKHACTVIFDPLT